MFLPCPLPTRAHTVVMLLVNSFTIKSKQSLVSLFSKGENLTKNGKTHVKQNTNVTIFKELKFYQENCKRRQTNVSVSLKLCPVLQIYTKAQIFLNLHYLLQKIMFFCFPFDHIYPLKTTA